LDIELAVGRYKGAKAPIGTVKRDFVPANRRFMTAIIGPRRAGKTTLMLQIMDALPLPDSNKILLNGEDVGFEGMTADDLSKVEEAAFRTYRPDTAKDVVLFIDEVQRFPSWARWLRTLHDGGRYEIFVSGSTSELSTDRLPSTLRGRALNSLVFPFSFGEFLRAKSFGIEGRVPPERAGMAAALFDEYVEYGGFPAVVLSEGTQLKMRVLQELFDAVLQRDMLERLRVRNPPALRAFVAAVLGSAARPLSSRSIARWLETEGLRVGRQAALNYLEGAEEVFMIRRLYPYSARPKERQVNPKVYAIDTGLLGLLGADMSKKLENAVLVELLRRGRKVSYWRSAVSGREVDFVVEDGGKARELVQVAYSVSGPAAYEREVGALTAAAEELGVDRLTAITSREERSLREEGKEIQVVTAWKWFLGGSRPSGP